MKHQNHLLKRYGTVLSRTLLCSTLTFTPFAGVENMMADTSQMGQTTLRGTVVDENGEPIIGANIMVVGGKATLGTISDMDGNFQLHVKAGTKIKVSYVGFETQTLTVKNGMRITMIEDSKTTLKGVEVVAYGVQKKVSVTGALSSVKGDDLVRTPVGSVNNVLGGQLSLYFCCVTLGNDRLHPIRTLMPCPLHCRCLHYILIPHQIGVVLRVERMEGSRHDGRVGKGTQRRACLGRLYLERPF